MLEKARDYLTSLFKTAYHSILKAFRLFLPLFIAIFLIESILFTIFLAFQNNIALRNDKIEREYTHHLTVSGLKESEMLLLRNDDRTLSRNDMCFDVIKTMKYESAAYDPTYTVYIKILTGNKNYGIWGLFIDDSLEANYDLMVARYADVFGTEEKPNNHISIEYTPLHTKEADERQLNFLCGVSLLFASLLSAVVFCSLYRVYLEEKKFSFGIYTAFGATKHELRTQAMAELSIASAALLLPSYYIASLLCRFIYQNGSSSFSAPIFSLGAWLFILLLSGITLYLAVFFAMKGLTHGDPMKLLVAEGEANTVSSPRRSYDLLKGKFPFSFEWISMLRFRRHHIALTLFSALLSISFMLGFYFSAIYERNAAIGERTDPHFTLRFSNVSVLSEDYTTIFQGLDNVSSAYTLPNSSSAEEYASFLRVPDKNILSKNTLVRDEENALYYTGNVRLYSGAFDIADYFSSVYSVSGEPERFLSDPQNILIGKTVENKDAFSFNVGDTITLAVAETDEEGNVVYLNEEAEKLSNLTGRSFWKAAYESFAFRYYTFTVVGIIENYPSGVDGVPVVMHPEAYKSITGASPTVDQMTVRVDDDATTKEFIDVESALRGIASRLGNCTVTTERAFFENNTENLYCYAPLLRFVTAMFLLFLPISWLYSQSLFFKKREKEFYVLGAISAPLSRIRSIYLCNALILIPIALLSFVTSLIISGVVFFVVERYLPSVLSIGGAVVEIVSLPFYVYFIGIAVTIPSCLLSLLHPYFRYKKKYYSEKAATHFQADN